ncbi:MAG: tetratricopeptide repeat protein, partial [Rhodospirillales bacterium]|nr:tetratricopeptide repeat protein [Rhodospirillales bacterium]
MGYRRVLALRPDHPDALHLLGVLAFQTGHYGPAVELIERAIGRSSSSPEYHYHLGLAQCAGENFAKGIAAFERALALRANYPEALMSLGSGFARLGRLAEAEAQFRHAIRLQPSNAEAYANLGNVLLEQDRWTEAVDSCRQAIKLGTRAPDIHFHLARALARSGQSAEAEAAFYGTEDAFRRAIANQPGNPEFHYHLGNILLQLDRLDDAVAVFRNAIELKPDHGGAHNNLGKALWQLGYLEEAAASCARSVELAPTHPEPLCGLGLILTEQGRIAEAVKAFDRALELRPDYRFAASNMLLSAQYRPGISAASLARMHWKWDAQYAAPLKSAWRPFANGRDPDRRLCVGFLSADLGTHPVGFFLTACLEVLDRQQIEIVCYSLHRREDDDLATRLRAAADIWVDAEFFDDEALAGRIRDDHIDILIDLAGHTGENRLLVFARKPAPIQMTWAGYVGTTGLEAIDYLIADRFHVPEGEDIDYREKILRLPDGYVCYAPPAYAPPVGPLPARRNSYATFGCFNNLAKIGDDVITLWTQLLDAVPNARLLLKTRAFNDAPTAERIRDLFRGRNADIRRIDIEGSSPHAELLGRYNDVDLALDPFPYSGGLTTCEALWMGVPVVTMPGLIFASRHSYSHLSNVGLTETIAKDPRDYLRLATALAGDLDRLAALRAGLREKMARSPLCDGSRFAAN